MCINGDGYLKLKEFKINIYQEEVGNVLTVSLLVLNFS